MRPAANFVERLRERYSRSKILVLIDSDIGQLVQPSVTVLAKPYQLHDVVQQISTLAPVSARCRFIRRVWERLCSA
jgi:hypothetical protein